MTVLVVRPASAADAAAFTAAVHLTPVILGAFRSGYLGHHAFAGFEGRGLMTPGLNAVVRHAFKHLGLSRIKA